jgi:hypothetical protein
VTILVTIIVFAGLLTVIGAVIFVLGQALRGVTGQGRRTPPTITPRQVANRPVPFGALPSLSDPVGPLGNLAPGADLSSNADSEREIYGE